MGSAALTCCCSNERICHCGNYLLQRGVCQACICQVGKYRRMMARSCLPIWQIPTPASAVASLTTAYLFARLLPAICQYGKQPWLCTWCDLPYWQMQLLSTRSDNPAPSAKAKFTWKPGLPLPEAHNEGWYTKVVMGIMIAVDPYLPRQVLCWKPWLRR